MLTLIVLAAGLGRRFGADKQIARVGPDGQTLLDFTLHDAWRAGFGRVVFVLRPDLLGPFADTYGPRWDTELDLRLVVQDPADLPPACVPPAPRDKPWGTLHAVWCARAHAGDRCAVLNADDLYGAAALSGVAQFLRAVDDDGDVNGDVNGDVDGPGDGPGDGCRGGALRACLPGYPLAATLSRAGSVNRGICRTTEDWLLGVDEVTDIAQDADGVIRGRQGRAATRCALDPDTPVSMNLWAWQGRPWDAMAQALSAFLEDPHRSPQAEAYLPAFWDRMVRDGQTRCRVLPAPEGWTGLTHPQDLERVRHHVQELCTQGRYATMPALRTSSARTLG
jgi:hypothetical protein